MPTVYTSLEKSPLRRDWYKNIGYSNEIEFMDCGVTKIMEHFADPSHGRATILSNFISVDIQGKGDLDPKDGYGFRLIGYTMPKRESTLQVGNHLIARIHDNIPEIVIKFFNYFVVRNSYSVRKNTYENMSDNELKEFYDRQLISFNNSMAHFLKFLDYELFTDLGADNGQFDESLKNPHFEEFKTEIYSPANVEEQGTPFITNLSLEQVTSDYKEKKNPIKEHITHLRGVLTTHKVTYDKAKTYYDHDIPQNAKAVFALKEKITDVCLDMVDKPTKYRLTETNKKGFDKSISPEDLIVIINPKDQLLIDQSIPLAIKPQDLNFTTDTLKCGRVIQSQRFKPGTALIIHKDVLKFIVITQEYGTAFYPEQLTVNHFTRLGWLMEAIELYPCAFIKPQ